MNDAATPTLETVVENLADGKTTFQLNTLSEDGTKIMVVGFGDKRESCWGLSGEEMDGYFVYRRSTLKGHIASNKFYVMLYDDFI